MSSRVWATSREIVAPDPLMKAQVGSTSDATHQARSAGQMNAAGGMSGVGWAHHCPTSLRGPENRW